MAAARGTALSCAQSLFTRVSCDGAFALGRSGAAAFFEQKQSFPVLGLLRFFGGISLGVDREERCVGRGATSAAQGPTRRRRASRSNRYHICRRRILRSVQYSRLSSKTLTTTVPGRDFRFPFTGGVAPRHGDLKERLDFFYLFRRRARKGRFAARHKWHPSSWQTRAFLGGMRWTWM
jgi:hypothetical protein